MSNNQKRWRLGLDLGSNSLGWAALECAEQGATEPGAPVGILGMGVRIFEAGVEGDIESGKEESRTVARRTARLARRQHERRARRRRNLFKELRRSGLLPGEGVVDSDAINQTLEALDLKFAPIWVKEADHREAQLLPYLLRAAAAERHVQPHELGRALYHLAHRRGFASNRKESTKQKDDEDLGKVKADIAALREAMGSRTLGQYFASLDPHERRIRQRWTGREMYAEEFARIRDAQRGGPADLDDAAWKRLNSRIFKQRPLKSQKGKVGRCEFIGEDRRAPKWIPEFQRFRLLQAVNHLRVRTPVAEGVGLTSQTRRGFEERPLTIEERKEAVALLEQEQTVKLTKLRTKLGLKGTTFGIEAGGEKELRGDVTGARMRKVFGEQWDTMDEPTRARIFNDILSVERDAVLERRGREVWGLDEEAAAEFVRIRLEEGYATAGRRALKALLPHLEAGLSVQEACKPAFPDRFVASEKEGWLAPVRKSLYHLRNPAVERALTELRRVVNELIREWGPPDTVVIELARDLKRSKKDRQRMTKENRSRQGERETAADTIAPYIAHPSRDDIERALLHAECGGKCPYTGRSISLSELFSKESPWDVEHIIPYSRSLDNSFRNKTLCWAEENRNRKGNKTPFEAYRSAPDQYEAILARAAKFSGDDGAEKLRRFKLADVGADVTEEFCSRQLNDTRYTSRLACAFMESLYGGRADADGRQRVFASAGQATAIVRRALGIEGILRGPGGQGKTRDDHRHHAIDALAISLTTPSMVKQLASLSESSWLEKRRRVPTLPSPWATFSAEVRETVDNIVVSHRPNRSLSGPLHQDTNYSRAIGGVESARHVRKPVSYLTNPNRAEEVVDDAVRSAIVAHVEAHGGDWKCLENAEDPPRLPGTDGVPGTPIRRVRLRATGTLAQVGRGGKSRYVAPGANHHAAIVAVLDKDGNPAKWEGHIVTRLEAVQRKQRGEPVIQRDWGEGRRFCFTLSAGDMVRLTVDGQDDTWVIESVSGNQVAVKFHAEARPRGRGTEHCPDRRFKPSFNGFMKTYRATRLEVKPTGIVTACNA